MITFCLDSNEQKLTAIILDIVGHILFKAVGIKKVEIDKRSFLKLSFANDGINLGNILHHKSVKSKIPPYFKDQSVPIISYIYTRPIASKYFNYKHVLHNLNIDGFKSMLPDCTCASSPFIYNPTGHVITDELKVINTYGFRRGLCQTMGKARKWGLRYSFRMDEECEIAHTDYN